MAASWRWGGWGTPSRCVYKLVLPRLCLCAPAWLLVLLQTEAALEVLEAYGCACASEDEDLEILESPMFVWEHSLPKYSKQWVSE